MKVNNLSKSPSLALFSSHVFLKFVSTMFLLVCFVSLKERTYETKKNTFLLHFESLFSSLDNQVLTLNLNFKNQILNFQIFKCHDVIKFPDMKHETNFTE